MAVQLPAEGHDTEFTIAVPSLASAPTPGTGSSRPHLPWTSSTTKAVLVDKLVEIWPPALQLPTDGHDIASTSSLPSALSRVVPGSSNADCQWPWTSFARNTWL